jgi:Family of unknown function (DUF5681)
VSDIGYGKPPLANRFQAGVSGNPRGRPKNALNVRRELADELAEFVEIGGTKVTKFRAIVKAVVDKALAGDLRSASTVLALSAKLNSAAAADDEEEVDPTDRAIADAAAERQRKRAAGDGGSSPGGSE